MNTNLISKIVNLRQELHAVPEPALQEHRTKAALMDFLRAESSLSVTDMGKWFYALYEPDNCSAADRNHYRKIAFRADFDAVLGCIGKAGHYCGHEGHAASLAGLGLLLGGLSRKDRARQCNNTIYLIFQPAEESGEGAPLCAPLLKEAKIEEIYGFHNIPGFPEGSILLREGTFACASSGVEYNFTGRPSHAAYPEAGTNPSSIVADMIKMALEVKGEVNEDGSRQVLLATIIGADIGSRSFGVSASAASLRLTLRGENPTAYKQLMSRFEDFARDTATAQGIRCEINYYDPFPATVNNSSCVLKVEEAAFDAGLKTLHPAEPFRWSEDFGHYLQEIPGAFFGVGVGEDYPQLHTDEYSFNDRIIPVALEVFQRLALR